MPSAKDTRNEHFIFGTCASSRVFRFRRGVRMTSISIHVQQSTPERPGTRERMGIYVPIILALILRVASSPTASVSYLALAIFALFGRGQAILALALSWLFTMINPEIVAEGDGGSVDRYLVILAASATALFRSGLLSRQAQSPRPFTV